MRTAFSPKRMADSQQAHIAAQKQVYPELFPGLPLEFASTVKTVADFEYAIDCQVQITVPGLRAPLLLDVQERWRNPADMGYGDITVTEWNLPSDSPSELHKLGAHLFVYGFYDPCADKIPLAVAVEVPRMIMALSRGDLRYERRKRNGGDQTFLGFQLHDLAMTGAVCLIHDPDRQAPPPWRFATDS